MSKIVCSEGKKAKGGTRCFSNGSKGEKRLKSPVRCQYPTGCVPQGRRVSSTRAEKKVSRASPRDNAKPDKDAVRFWKKNKNLEDFNALVLYLEAESETSCKNDCWSNNEFFIDNAKIIGQGKYGITYEASASSKILKKKKIQVIMKLTITDTVFEIQEAEKESRNQKEAADALPDVVANIYSQTFCSPKCLNPSQGVYSIVVEKLGRSFEKHLDSLLNHSSNGKIHEARLANVLLRELRKAANQFHKLNAAGFLHRDAHADNILLTLDGTDYKIIDFGLSKQLNKRDIDNFKNYDAFFFVVRILNDYDITKTFGNEEIRRKTERLLSDFRTSRKAVDAYKKEDDRCKDWLRVFERKYGRFFNIPKY